MIRKSKMSINCPIFAKIFSNYHYVKKKKVTLEIDENFKCLQSIFFKLQQNNKNRNKKNLQTSFIYHVEVLSNLSKSKLNNRF